MDTIPKSNIAYDNMILKLTSPKSTQLIIQANKKGHCYCTQHPPWH